jgi:hypothetical protein
MELLRKEAMAVLVQMRIQLGHLQHLLVHLVITLAVVVVRQHKREA